MPLLVGIQIPQEHRAVLLRLSDAVDEAACVHGADHKAGRVCSDGEGDLGVLNDDAQQAADALGKGVLRDGGREGAGEKRTRGKMKEQCKLEVER